LPDEFYKFNVSITDLAGNKNTTETRNLTIDTISPYIEYEGLTLPNGTGVSNNYIYVNITSSDLTTGIANLTFFLSDSSSELNRTFISGVHNFTINFTSLADGTYLYNVTASDFSGNKNTTSRRTIILDTVSPILFFTTNTPTSNLNTTSISILMNVTVTDVNPVNLTFILVNSTGEVNRTFVTIAVSGNYSLNFTSLTDDFYDFNVTVTDITGSKEFTETRNITIDTIAPFVDLLSATPSNNTNQSVSSSIIVNFTSSDLTTGTANLTFILVNISNGFMTEQNRTFIFGFHNFSLTFTNLDNGTYLFNVTASDFSGNKNTTGRRTVNIVIPSDSDGPIIEFISETPLNATNTSSTTIFINATVFDSSSNVGTCLLTWQQGASLADNFTMTKTSNSGSASNVTCNYTHVGLSDARYTYKILANDTLGNFNLTNVRELNIDTINPSLNITVESPQLDDQNITVWVTASDASEISDCWYRLFAFGGNEERSNTSIGDCQTFTLTTNFYKKYNVTVYNNDTASNQNKTSASFTTAKGQIGGGPTGGGAGGGSGRGGRLNLTYLCNTTYNFTLHHFQHGEFNFTQEDLKSLQTKIKDETLEELPISSLQDSAENIDIICRGIIDVVFPTDDEEPAPEKKETKKVLSILRLDPPDCALGVNNSFFDKSIIFTDIDVGKVTCKKADALRWVFHLKADPSLAITGLKIWAIFASLLSITILILLARQWKVGAMVKDLYAVMLNKKDKPDLLLEEP